MWPKFPEPKNSVTFRSGKFAETVQWKKTLEKSLYLYSIQLILPEVYSLPESIRNCFSTYVCSYQIIRKLPPHIFIDWEFIQTFIKHGDLYALSVDTFTETGNCFSVTPKGKLVITCQSDVYESLGLDGLETGESTKWHKVFKVEIDLLKPCFYPGKKNYERVKKALERNPSFACDFAFYWKPEDSSVSHLSLGEYFKSKGFLVEVKDPQYRFSQMTSVSVPNITHIEEDDDDIEGLFEWLGAQVCGIECPEECSDDSVSTFDFPGSGKLSQVFIAQWKGFFASPVIVEPLMLAVRENLKLKHLSFTSVLFHTPQNDPTFDWQKKNCYLFGRSQLYSVVALPDDSYYLYKAPGD